MKSALLAVATAFTILALSAGSGMAQQQTSEPGFVALLDVVRVFNENADHSSRMERIRQQAEAVKSGLEAKMEGIRTEAQQLMKMESGSPERNQKEAELEQRQTALSTEARQQEFDLLTEEARVYYQTWNRMQEVLAQVATHNKISLILRFDSAAIDPENRNDVIKGVNRSVIYHDSSFDITDMVIQQMGPTVAAGAAPAATTNR